MNPNPLEILTLAMARASAREDDAAVKKLAKLADDPGALLAALGDDEITQQFAQWQPGTSKAGTQGYVSPGGEFRKDKPKGADDFVRSGQTPSASARAAPAMPEGVSLAEVANHPDVKANPGILAKVKDATKKAVDLAKRAVLEVSLHSPQILSAWTDVFDHPDDLKKIGYNPGFSGTGGHGTTDPVKDSIGIPAHMAAGLVVKVGAAAITFLKKKLGGAKMSDESSDEGLKEFSEFLAKVIAAANAQYGIDYPLSAETIAMNLKNLRAEKRAGKA